MHYDRLIGHFALLCVLVTVGHPATAQQKLPARDATKTQTLPPGFTDVEGDSLPLADVLWALFMHATALDEQGLADGRVVLTNMGLDEASANVVFQHMRLSVDSKKQSDLMRRASFCGKRDRITSRDDIVREMNDMTHAAQQERERFVGQLSQLVDAQAYGKLLEAAEKLRPSMGKVEIDPAAYFSALPADAVADAVKRGCDPHPPSAPQRAKQR
jgi:hypothetical protein